MITERLMDPGQWTMTYLPDTPAALRDLVTWFGHVLILPSPVEFQAISDANMKSLARYVGRVRHKPSNLEVGGDGLLGWLGDDQGKGDVYESARALTATTGTLAGWASLLLPTTALAAGTFTPVQMASFPDFETAGGWVANPTGTGTTTLQDNTPHNGLRNLKLTNPSTGNYGGAFNSIGMPVAGMSSLAVSYWARASAAGTTGPFRITFANAGTNVNSNGIASAQPSLQAGTTAVDQNPALTTSYQQFTNTVTVPAGYTWAFIEIYSAGNGVPTPSFWDDIAINAIIANSFNQVAPRAAYDWLAKAFGAEFRATNDGKLDVAAAATLFKITPKAVVMRETGGRDLQIVGITADPATFRLDADAEDLSTRDLFIGAGGTAAASGALATYKDYNGGTAKITRVDNDGSIPAANVPLFSQRQFAAFSVPRFSQRMVTEQFDPHRDVDVGDNLWVFDSRQKDLQDTTNQVAYQGTLIFPVLLRVTAMTWALTGGYGIYYRDLNGVYIDLTSWVEPEPAAVSYELGAPARRLA